MTSYKTCAVPLCKNTTVKCPNKLFIHVPKCPKRRKQWLKLGRRDPEFISDKSAIFFCEDHFDLPNDMENYMQYSVMGSVGKIRMKPDCLPSKLQCQADQIKCTTLPKPLKTVPWKTATPATSGMTSKSDFPSLIMTPTTSVEETESEPSEIFEDLCRMSIEITLQLIKNNPSYYIGIPKHCYCLIDFIKKHTKLPEEHILLCLKKIRLDTPFSSLGDQFGMSLSYASNVFMKSVTLIERVLRPFIIKSNKRSVKRKLPKAYRYKYSNICIIDCLEIEIQKPLKSVEQALTWAEYKKANTVKYLISCTPDGIINYISPGFSGRTTDVFLIQNCSFLDYLEPSVSILAYRGFKHLEEYLLQEGINFVKPSSASNSKLSKHYLIKTKQIASLRIHIERVVRHLREFSMLTPHYVVNKELLKYLDECVVIACALINIQDGIINNK